MVNRRLNIWVFSLLLLFISCGVREKEFNKDTWNQMDDFMYANRESMVKDLMENHLQKGMTYKEVIVLLGNSQNYSNMKRNTIGYEIMVDYGSNIDPVKGKTLYIELTNDSIVKEFKLEKWNH